MSIVKRFGHRCPRRSDPISKAIESKEPMIKKPGLLNRLRAPYSVVAFLSMIVAGCDSVPERDSPVAEGLRANAAYDASRAARSQQGPLPGEDTLGGTRDTSSHKVLPASDEVVPVAGQLLNVVETKEESGGGDTAERNIVLNFQGADLQEVVKVVLGEILGRNYIIDPAVSGQVTTETSAGLGRADVLPVLNALLGMNGAALIDRGGVVEVVPSASASRRSVPSLKTKRLGFSTTIFPLVYVAAAEMEKILSPILKEGALVYLDAKRNLLILAGTSAEQARYAETIRTFDVNWMAGMSVGLFKLEFAPAKDIADELSRAVGGEGGSLFDGLVRLIEIERLNGLLAISASGEALNEARRWIERLDVPGDTREAGLYVVRLQNAKAADVAAILGELFAQTGATRRADVELAPGNRPVTVTSGDAEAQAGTAPPESASAIDENVLLELGKNAKIIADETNNGLVIMATPREYKVILSAIERLDIVPLQVLVEATIVEVTLSEGARIRR